MFVVPMLICILLVLAFPRLVRFLLTFCAFGVLFIVASCIDHANAQEIPLNVTSALSNCLNGNAQLQKAEWAKMTGLGGDAASALAMSCGGFMDSFVFYCQRAGKDQATCYRYVKEEAAEAIIEAK